MAKKTKMDAVFASVNIERRIADEAKTNGSLFGGTTACVNAALLAFFRSSEEDQIRMVKEFLALRDDPKATVRPKGIKAVRSA